MIEFKNNNIEIPYLKLRENYKKALLANQNAIEAISVASYCINKKEVDSRYVNLKIIDNEEFIFFTNYHSPKAHQFDSHNKVSVLILWDSINTQVRIKATIKRTSHEFNNKYFMARSKEKNALAVCSNQSKEISSYESVVKKYDMTYKNFKNEKCPDHWGGYVFKPHYFEFWLGHESRINKREVYRYENGSWEDFILEP